MRFKCLLCLTLASLLYGQAAPPAPPSAAAPSAPGVLGHSAPAPEVKVGPDDPVITLKGFCADSSQQGDACKTVIDRAQFEKVVDALQPGMPPALRRQLATRYSYVLKMSSAAEKRGLDKTPLFEQKMQFARMQILSQELSVSLQADSQKVSDEDVADYYKKNESSYVQATLARIFVPRSKQIPTPAPTPKPKTGAAGAKATAPKATPQPTEAQKKAAEEAMTKLAETIRARAAKGENVDKLQKEAFTAAGMPANAINTKVEKARRSTLPPNHQSVMDLNPGEVSEVINDANSGHYIYKMITKETLTLETVSPEIKKTIGSQRYRDSMQGFQGNVDLNDAYFGAARGPGMPPPRGARPNAEHADDPDRD
jgi:bifunctional DNA-binding transcriptional regulator/antitoxin component of YhaV-PrlF toxin-antitoxin module